MIVKTSHKMKPPNQSDSKVFMTLVQNYFQPQKLLGQKTSKKPVTAPSFYHRLLKNVLLVKMLMLCSIAANFICQFFSKTKPNQKIFSICALLMLLHSFELEKLYT